ncbi:MAG: glycine oxidase [Alteromonadaceae bacterium]|jgi:glycine oxidase
MTKVAVLGAGLMGRLTALCLDNKGFAVSLYDKDSKSGSGSAAFAAGGLLRPLGESLGCDCWIVEMGFAALQQWPSLLSQLEAPVYFQRQGLVVLAHQQNKGDMQRFRRNLDLNW